MTRRTPAILAYALGCFAAIVAWTLWAEFAGGGAGKGGWSWGVALAVPIALWPTLPFALALALGARHGLRISRRMAVSLAAVAGAMTPGAMLIARFAAQALGTRIPLFDGLMGGLLVMSALGATFGAALAMLRAPRPPAP